MEFKELTPWLRQFSTRLCNALAKADITTESALYDALNKGNGHISIRGLGKKSLAELNEYLPMQLEWTGSDSFKYVGGYSRYMHESENDVQNGNAVQVIETDEIIIGAKKAFYFILDQTGDKGLAANAFNSYLLGKQRFLGA